MSGGKRWRRKIKRKRRHAEINESNTEELETKLRLLNRRCGLFAIFRPAAQRKIWLLSLYQ